MKTPEDAKEAINCETLTESQLLKSWLKEFEGEKQQWNDLKLLDKCQQKKLLWLKQ